MFRTRISFSFSRIFRLRRRRAAKADPSPTNVAVVPCSGPPPPSKSRRPVPAQLKPVNTTPTASTRRPCSLFLSSGLSPIAQSPLTPPAARTPPTILIIRQDPPQSTFARPPAPAPPDHVGPQTLVNGVSLAKSPPAPSTRRVSFQLPITDTEDRPESPLSTCSTLVTEAEAEGEADPEMALEIPSEQPSALEALGSGSVGAVSAELISETPSLVRSGSGRARPFSPFSPRPVRADVSRFSLPVTPVTPIMATGTNARDARRDSKRPLSIPPTSGSGPSKKDKRSIRWSSELNKPETQEVLRVLRGL